MSFQPRLLGHPLHPILNHMPLGLLPVALLFDILALWFGSSFWWAAAFWNIVVGLIAALPTVASGMVDFAAYVRGAQVERLAMTHLIVMLSALSLFILSLVFRHGQTPEDSAARWLALGMDFAGTVLLGIGGWFGGELVYGHGTSVRNMTPKETAV